MSIELRVTLQGPADAMDASRVANDVQQLVKMLNELEVLRAESRHAETHSTWTFARLSLGSVVVGLAPLEVRGNTTWSDLDAVGRDLLDGFAHVEHEDSIPGQWAPEVARPAKVVAGHLGSTADTGMSLALYSDALMVHEVVVTRRAAANLRRALSVRTRSVGSVIGTLQSVSVHSRNRAGLWSDRTGRRVTVRFKANDTDVFRDAFGKRVMVKGLLERNPAGQLLGVEFKRLEVLPDKAESPRLSTYTGFYPDASAELTRAAEHLGGIRGAS